MNDLEELRYPIGRFNSSAIATRSQQIGTLRLLPKLLREVVNDFDDSQLDTPYRDGGWTVRQLVHHVADSHLNSYIRFKLALTEEAPTICAYDENSWARLPDSRMPVSVSLDLLESVHARLVHLLEQMTDADFARTFIHPERGSVTLANNLALYDWHSRHHTAHITRLRQRMGW